MIRAASAGLVLAFLVSAAPAQEQNSALFDDRFVDHLNRPVTPVAKVAPRGLLGLLLGGPKVAADDAGAAPMEILPQKRDVATTRRTVRGRVAVSAFPPPRLRPTHTVATVAAPPPKAPMAVAEIMAGAMVSTEITGSLSRPADAPTPEPAVLPQPVVALPNTSAPVQVAEVKPQQLLPEAPVVEPVAAAREIAAQSVEEPSHDAAPAQDTPAAPVPVAEVAPPPGPSDFDVDDHPLITLPATAEPYELIRILQMLQDQIAQGSTQAFASQRTLLERIDELFEAADPGVWQVPRNASAAVIYVLSGGSPVVLRRLAALELEPSIDRALIGGVLDYIEGREDSARAQLADFDPFDLPPNMGAPLALAKAALSVRVDPDESMRLLGIARLLAPGTLVEEAALRREIFVADQLNDGAAVEKLARRYMTRFRHSVYAGNFRNRFASALSRLGIARGEAGLQRLDAMLQPMDAKSRGDLYLIVALAATVKGDADVGAYAAGRALELAPADSLEEARSFLYRAATLLTDPLELGAAQQALENTNVEVLSPSDQALHQSVGVAVKAVASGTDMTALRQVASADDGAPLPDETSPLLTRARDLLNATEGLVESVSQ